MTLHVVVTNVAAKRKARGPIVAAGFARIPQRGGKTRVVPVFYRTRRSG